MSEIKTNYTKRMRGVVLGLVRSNHAEQGSQMDDITMCSLMQKLGYGLGQNDVLALLQDLRDRGYLVFEEKQNRLTYRSEIRRIQITPAGRDILEETKIDPAVLVD